MKSVVLVSFGICCIILQQCNAAVIKHNSLDDQWQDFKTKYYKVYVSNEEETLHKKIFKTNIEIIKNHNEKFEKGEVTWKMGINEFTDMTAEEIKKRLGFGVRTLLTGDQSDLDAQWQDFKTKFNKVYETPEEDSFRKEIFKLKMMAITEHNEKYRKGEVTWEMGVNTFTDMTAEEIRGMLGFGLRNVLSRDQAEWNVQWQDYKTKFNKVYETPEEDSFRKEIFKMKMMIITEHNEKYLKKEVTWEMGVNTFTDMTTEEIKKMLGFGVRTVLTGDHLDLNAEWQDFKTKFNKVYEAAEEDSFRKEIFKLNMEKINEHNEKYRKGEVTWEMGVNKFTDMTADEVKKMLGFRITSGFTTEDLEFVDQWESFKSEYNKHYATAQEEKFCKDIFRINLEKINKHNDEYDKNEVSFLMGINEFTDITFEEFKIRNGAYISKPSFSSRSVEIVKASENTDLPKEVDWVKYGYIQNVWIQGSCGSCYAMAVTAAIEGHWYIKHKEIITLSQQELIDCSFSYGNMGCQYGDLNNSFKYVVENGIGTWMKYPYIQRVNECKRTTPEEDTRYNITSWAQTKAEDEVDLKRAVANGPVIAVINTGLSSFQHYTDGVYYDKECRIDPLSVNHFVLIVGYGTSDKGEDYWLIKNSWGSFWGMKGYMRIARNRGNQCGIATEAMYPIL